jgi:hypothetical protein
MKNLYEYIQESLLDDFDDLSKSQDTYNYLQEFDILAGFKDSKLEDGNLILGDVLKNTRHIITNRIYSHLKSIKDILEIDSINCIGGLELDVTNIDDSAFNVINIKKGYLSLTNSRSLKDLTINVHGNTKLIKLQTYNPIEINNCKINYKVTGNYGILYVTGESPNIKNSKITGVECIVCYDAFGVRDRSDSKLTSIFDESYIMPNFTESPKPIKKKGSLRNVCAAVNNQRKYPLSKYTKEQPLFKVDKNFKLESVIDIKCFDKKLEHIEFADNGVGILFFKSKDNKHPNPDGAFYNGSKLRVHNTVDGNTQPLPNNKGWYVSVLNRV